MVENTALERAEQDRGPIFVVDPSNGETLAEIQDEGSDAVDQASNRIIFECCEAGAVMVCRVMEIARYHALN